MGLRGRPDADDPMNLIRIMPAEGVLRCCARQSIFLRDIPVN
jgi:hypothetical protein